MREAFEAGLHGYIDRSARRSELIRAIRDIHAGRKVIPAQLASQIVEQGSDEALTKRELQILHLVARGQRNKEVATSLLIAEETVRMHLKNIFGKLAAHDRTHAVTTALQRGIFQLDRCGV